MKIVARSSDFSRFFSRTTEVVTTNFSSTGYVKKTLNSPGGIERLVRERQIHGIDGIISITVTAQALARYGSHLPWRAVPGNRTRITLMLQIHADFLRFYTLTGTRPRKYLTGTMSDQSAESAFDFLAAEKLPITGG